MSTLGTISIIAGETLRRSRRRRHLPVLFVVTLGVAGAFSYLTFFGSSRYEQFFCHIMMLVLPLISVLVAVLTTAWELPGLMADRTVHMMLARPVKRWHVVAGTYLGVCVTSLAMYCLFVFMFLMALAWRGMGQPPALAHAFVLLGIQVVFFCALALLMSLLTTPAMTTVVCVFYYCIGQLIQPTLAPKLTNGPMPSRASAWVMYVVLPHLNYFNLVGPVVHQWPAVPAAALLPVVLYGLGWSALLVVLAAVRFEQCEL